MSSRFAWLFCCTLATSGVASAQTPADLFECVSWGPEPTCTQIVGGVVIAPCGDLYFRFEGRYAWYPLRNLGSIAIEVKTLAFVNDLHPLYVEVVPYQQPPGFCNHDLGYVVFTTRGNSSECGGWETSRTVDITPFVPVGGLYGIRFYALMGRDDFSPGLDCVRVTGSSTTSAIRQGSWGFVKTLFR